MITKIHSSSRLQYVSHYTTVDGSAPPAMITNDRNYVSRRRELRQRDVIMKHGDHWGWLWSEVVYMRVEFVSVRRVAGVSCNIERTTPIGRHHKAYCWWILSAAAVTKFPTKYFRMELCVESGVDNWRGYPLPIRLGVWGSVMSSQRGPGRSPGRQRIFGIFEAHRTLLLERTLLPYWMM